MTYSSTIGLFFVQTQKLMQMYANNQFYATALHEKIKNLDITSILQDFLIFSLVDNGEGKTLCYLPDTINIVREILPYQTATSDESKVKALEQLFNAFSLRNILDALLELIIANLTNNKNLLLKCLDDLYLFAKIVQDLECDNNDKKIINNLQLKQP